MSNFLAIAMVSATLKRLLHTAVQNAVTGATATTLRPDAPAAQLPNPGANIFLYQAVANTNWRNADLPSRNRRGHLVQRPVVALDLHYLMTFYGTDSDFEPQRIMGSVVSAMHSRPILTQGMIQKTLDAARNQDPDHYLLKSDLADDIEQVKFTPLPLTLEELSKLWSMMSQTPYSLSQAYLGTVVFIEAQQSPRSALPVREPRLFINPFRRATIDEITPEDGGDAIEMGESVLIHGSDLDGPLSFIRVGVARLQPVTGSEGADTISVALTDPSLRAGVQGVQIVYDDGSESNIGALILRPIISVNPGTTTQQVTLSFDPPVEPSQQVELFLNEFNPPNTRVPYAYSFSAPADNGITDPLVLSTTAITFAITSVQAGNYLVRVRVNGAENVLGTGIVDSVEQYNAPVVTIP